MTAILATLALALAPAVDAAETILHRPPPRHHHRRHPRRHPRRRADPPMSTALASWYSYPPGASTACGFDAELGVANRTLPCGTRVRICARRCATATVDDRGPYVYSRLWDLSAALASAIGFDFAAGVAPVRWALTP